MIYTILMQMIIYNSFFSPAPIFSEEVAIGSFLAFCAVPEPKPTNKATIATRASLTRMMIAVQARNQAWMLMLPNGARGKERSHSA